MSFLQCFTYKTAFWLVTGNWPVTKSFTGFLNDSGRGLSLFSLR